MRHAAVALAGAAVLALAGCTSSTGGTHRASEPPSSPAAPSTPAPTTSVAYTPPPVANSTTHPTASKSVPTKSATSTSPPVVERSTCTHVTVRVVPGGAVAGSEFAALQFTNSGTSPCVLAGYPTVTLLSGGKQIAKPSEPSVFGRASRRELAPGATAQSNLHDYTQNCQAPLSDSLTVVVPGSTITYHRPQFVMRGCVLRVDALGATD